jgi:hypothetical protein
VDFAREPEYVEFRREVRAFIEGWRSPELLAEHVDAQLDWL